MKIIVGLLIGMVLQVSSQAFGTAEGTSDLTMAEKRQACRAIAQDFDYDSGVSLSLCASGAWNVSDVEIGSGHRQVAFEWEGKVSRFQGGVDRCSGYVHSYLRRDGKKRIEVLDLKCH